MPQVPTYNGPQVEVQPAGIPQARATGAAAQGVGAIAKGLGDQSRLFVELAKQEQERQDKAVTDEAKAQVLSLKNQMETDAHSVTGRGVMPGYNEDGEEQAGAPSLTEQYYGDFKEKVNEIGAKLTRSQSEIMRPFVIAHAADLEKSLLAHEISERDKWQGDQTKALLNLQVDNWKKAPEANAETARADAMATLATMFTGTELELQRKKYDREVNINRVAGAMAVDPAAGKAMMDRVPKAILDDQDRAELMKIGQQAVRAKVNDLNDQFFQSTMLPALEKKAFIPDPNSSAQFQQIKALDPSAAYNLEKHAQTFNAGLAMDHFSDWMTNLSSAQRDKLVFEKVPQQLRDDLKQYNPEAYNALAKRFDEEKQLRADRAAARKAAHDAGAMLMVNALLSPDSVDQNALTAMIQHGDINPVLGLKILENAQKGGDVTGRLHDPQFAQIIKSEIDQLTMGISSRSERKAAQERIAGTIYDVLASTFTSKFQVTPEAIKSALQRMRGATLTESHWYGSRTVPALSVEPDANVGVDRKYNDAVEVYRRQQGLTRAQAAARFSLWRSLGKNTFPVYPER